MPGKKYSIIAGIVKEVDINTKNIKVELPTDTVDLCKINDNEEDTYKIAYPLLPSSIHVLPKVNEAVILLISAINADKSSDLYYIGPIISRPDYLENDDVSHAFQSRRGSANEATPDIMSLTSVKGAFAGEDDVALYGRKNSDIILKDDAAILRCGAREADNDEDRANVAFSNNNAFMLLRKSSGDTPTTDATIAADNIVLTTKKDEIKNKNNGENVNTVLDNEEVNNLIEQAHKLPYGDALVDFLENFVRVFANHRHNLMGPPDRDNGEYGVGTFIGKYFEDGNVDRTTVTTSTGQLAKDILSDNIKIL